MQNPFIYGNPVEPDQLIGRKKKLRQIAGRINTGQSTIITGSPRSGKSSVLEYLIAPEKQEYLYGDEADKLIFSYWDACTCPPEFTLAQFWQRILRPLEEYIEAKHPDSELAKAYKICQENEFDNYELEKLIAEIKKIDKRLVLIIDEFDLLLDSSFALYGAEFFGGLRTLTSRSKGGLVLVITTNISQSRLHKETKQFSGKGSPYFNFTVEIVLGALSDTEIDELLKSGNKYFTKNDKHFMRCIAGGHPYLLQVVASILWKTYKEDDNDDKLIKNKKELEERQKYTVKTFSFRVVETLEAIWYSMDEDMQKTFNAITFAHIEYLGIELPKQINIKSIIETISDFKIQLTYLKMYGFLVEDRNIRGGLRIYPSIFLPFLIFEILKLEYSEHLRNEKKIGEKLCVTNTKKYNLFKMFRIFK